MISVIVCSNDPNRFESVKGMYERSFRGVEWQLLGIHDAKSLAEGYNRAIAKSTGEIIVLSHDDVEIFSPEPAQRLLKHLETFDLVGVAGTSRLVHPYWPSAGHPHIFGQIVHVLSDGKLNLDVFGAPFPVVDGIQALDGVFMAGRRPIFQQIQFDAEMFDGFHLYDLDFTYRAFSAGLRIGVVNDICLLHRSGGKFRDDWPTFARRFVGRHFPGGAPFRPERAVWAAISVNNLPEALEVMTPPYWRQLSESNVG
jgi:hypothetical protein